MDRQDSSMTRENVTYSAAVGRVSSRRRTAVSKRGVPTNYNNRCHDTESNEGDEEEHDAGSRSEEDKEQVEEEAGEEAEEGAVEEERPESETNKPETRDAEISDSRHQIAGDSTNISTTSPQYEVPSFACKMADLYDNMTTTLQIYSHDPRVQAVGMAHVRVTDFSTQALMASPFSESTINEQHAHITFNTFVPEKKGSVRLSSTTPSPTKLQHSEFAVPDISRTATHQDLSDAQLRQIFQEFCDSPPPGALRYLIGPPNIVVNETSQYNDLLSAGPWMKGALVHDIPGVSKSYLYISCSNQQTATSMHFEDCEWLSANVVICGERKLWLCIDTSSNVQFEACVERCFPGALGTCSQKIRHLNIIVPPRLLEEWGVKYHIKACEPGALMFTMPRAYHEVINLGANFSEAINFMTADTPTIPDGYVFCDPNLCGVKFPMSRTNFVLGTSASRKRGISDASVVALSKRHRLQENELRMNSLGIGEHLFHDHQRRTPAAVLASIISRQTFFRFASLIDSWRRTRFASGPALPGVTIEQSASKYAKVAIYDRNVVTSTNRADIFLLEARLSEYKFAESIDELKGDDEQRLSSEKLNKILSEIHKEGGKETQRSLRLKISQRTKWIHWCEGFGINLLPLFPLRCESPYFVAQDYFLRLPSDEVRRFHELANFPEIQKLVQKLCGVGRSILQMMTSDAEIMYKFEWTTTGAFSVADDRSSAFDQLVAEQWDDQEESLNSFRTGIPEPAESLRPQIGRLLAQFDITPLIQHNNFMHELHWPCPPDARRPPDPTSISRGEQQCSICTTDQQCDCIARLPQKRHRIAIGPRKHRVVIASISEVAGEPVYQEGEYIGELVGDIYPPGHEGCTGMFLELSQPCIPSHLHWTKTANWIYLVSHSCIACASFSMQVIGGRVRVMLRATEAIHPGTIITANFERFSGDVHKLRDCTHCEGPCRARSTL